ncbi:hypothetical protein DAPPUDRAFT_23177, partial [Daphnia pulex]
LFEDLKFSDIVFNVRGRQFKAHKNILATRSKFFNAMFEHPTKENLTNLIEVEDVEPAVFHEILRFIYTGKVSESTMGKMCVGILAATDKYLLDQLKMECETHIIHRMSVENCLELLLNTHEHHPAFHLRQYAVEFFRNFSSKVMATKDWEKAKKDDPEKCFSVLQDLVKSLCLVNGNLTINCVIESLIQKIPETLSKKLCIEADLDEKLFSNSDQLVAAELGELFETMKFSDIIFNVRGREFPAHKSILVARSKYFDAMFEHPTKENLTNLIEVEDVEPVVFHEILRFIYTGKVSESTMERMPAGILAVADKYLLDQLKMECETQLTHRMSAENCLELLLNTHEQHPAFHLRKYAVKFFRQFSGEVMVTDGWK